MNIISFFSVFSITLMPTLGSKIDVFLNKKFNENNDNPTLTIDYTKPDDVDGNTVQFAPLTMGDYFSRLYQYSPYNKMGTCGLVSLVQVLSFYDNFLNEEQSLLMY